MSIFFINPKPISNFIKIKTWKDKCKYNECNNKRSEYGEYNCTTKYDKCNDHKTKYDKCQIY